MLSRLKWDALTNCFSSANVYEILAKLKNSKRACINSRKNWIRISFNLQKKDIFIIVIKASSISKTLYQYIHTLYRWTKCVPYWSSCIGYALTFRAKCHGTVLLSTFEFLDVIVSLFVELEVTLLSKTLATNVTQVGLQIFVDFLVNNKWPALCKCLTTGLAAEKFHNKENMKCVGSMFYTY